ncbi:hypothetical protein M3A49_29470 [Paraburkholderia sp. CNPSo 3076]|nr:hypothetical protein [Paraburkholderia sp. CNPSo 3076]MCX5543569.1 hypothetical protein [Paraburkholderia sp. CNPSo 3076]
MTRLGSRETLLDFGTAMFVEDSTLRTSEAGCAILVPAPGASRQDRHGGQPVPKRQPVRPASQAGQQVFEPHGFRQTFVETGCCSLGRDVRVGVSRQQNVPGMRQSGVEPKLVHQFAAAHVRKPPVHEGKFGKEQSGNEQGLMSIGGASGLMTVELDERRERICDVAVVVD